MLQREDENYGAATPPVVQKRGISGMPVAKVGALSVGECYVRNINFYTPKGSNIAVTEVAVGASFDFTVDWKATNLLGSLIDIWCVCIVWWNGSTPAASTIKGYYYLSSSGRGATYIADNTARIANNYNYVMPNANVVLKFNMFINDDATPSPNYPPESDWMLLK